LIFSCFYIIYSEKYNNHYITITDKFGKVLLKGVDSKCYTTQARFDERENQKYVYNLTFYNNKLSPITSFPLTNKTDSSYEIPDDTYFACLSARHLNKKGKYSSSYNIVDIYCFFIDGKCTLHYDKANNDYYLSSPEAYFYPPIYSNYRMLKSEDELQKWVTNIIKYFNHIDLTYANNEEEFEKNDEGKAFEKQLIHYLKHSSFK